MPPRCQTPRYDSLRQARNPSLLASRQRLNALLAKAAREPKNTRTLRTQAVITIPVVVHVIHNNANGEIGGRNNGNISDAQIFSQIDVLNEDYRRQANTNGFNDDPIGADVEIEFQLARFDENGCPTTGITRTYDSQTSFDVDNDDKYLKSLAYWRSDRYLNIWVTSLDNNYLGYAQFPDAENIDGLLDFEPVATDGVVINHRVFGRRTGTATNPVYPDGRTTTHEVGHWLGLLHTFGEGYCDEDYCDDTPSAFNPNRTDDTDCQDTFSSCSGTEVRDMIENYMDYSPDVCMNIFTRCQKERMRNVLELSPRRAELVDHANEALEGPTGRAEGLSVKPNPADQEVTISFGCLEQSGDVQVDIINLLGKVVYAATYAAPVGEVTINVRPFTNGLYIVRVRSNSTDQSARLLVLK